MNDQTNNAAASIENRSGKAPEFIWIEEDHFEEESLERLILWHRFRDDDWRQRDVEKFRNVVPGTLSGAWLTHFKQRACRKRLNGNACAVWNQIGYLPDVHGFLCGKCQNPKLSIENFSELLWGRQTLKSHAGTLAIEKNVLRSRLKGTRVISYEEMRYVLHVLYVEESLTHDQVMVYWDVLDQVEAAGNVFLAAKKELGIPLSDLNEFICGGSVPKLLEEMQFSRQKEVDFLLGRSEEGPSKVEQLRMKTFSLIRFYEELERIQNENWKKGIDRMQQPDMTSVREAINDLARETSLLRSD